MKCFLIIVLVVVMFFIGVVCVVDVNIFWVDNSGGMEMIYIVVMGQDLNVQYQQVMKINEGVWVVNFGSISVDEVVLFSIKLVFVGDFFLMFYQG